MLICKLNRDFTTTIEDEDKVYTYDWNGNFIKMEENMKFKVGDKVKIIKDYGGAGDVGQEFIIGGIYPSTIDSVRGNYGRYTNYILVVPKDKIELVTASMGIGATPVLDPKFKAGDKVRVIKDYGGVASPGDTFIVDKIDKQGKVRAVDNSWSGNIKFYCPLVPIDCVELIQECTLGGLFKKDLKVYYDEKNSCTCDFSSVIMITGCQCEGA